MKLCSHQCLRRNRICCSNVVQLFKLLYQLSNIFNITHTHTVLGNNHLWFGSLEERGQSAGVEGTILGIKVLLVELNIF